MIFSWAPKMTNDRPRGILNERERAYLRGESGIEPQTQTERDTRAGIRRHLINTILDMQLVVDELEDRDWEQVLAKLEPDDEQVETRLADIVALAHRATMIQQAVFSTIVEKGIRGSKWSQSRNFEPITVEISGSHAIDIDRIIQKADRGYASSLTENEQEWLAKFVVSSEFILESDIWYGYEKMMGEDENEDTTFP